MCLSVQKEFLPTQAKKANELDVGTWFLDHDDQIYVLVMDDRTNERRVLCSGSFYKPFISNVAPKVFGVKSILLPGTLLKVVNSNLKGDDHVE